MNSIAPFDSPFRWVAGVFLLQAFFAGVNLQAQGTVNFVQNGSFEVITVVPGIETRALPWQGELSYNEGWSNAPDGRNYAHIGTVFQDISTAPAQVYDLTFWAAADLFMNAMGTIVVRWGGPDAAVLTTEPHPYDPGINRYEQIVWQQFQVRSLAATAPLTRLEFQATANSLILLDDVRLHAIPEPSACALLAMGCVILLCGLTIHKTICA
jgi:hypothetical protein